VIEDLAGDWHHLDARIEGITNEIETLARQDQHCERLMTVPGIGPIVSRRLRTRKLRQEPFLRPNHSRSLVEIWRRPSASSSGSPSVD